MITQMDTCIISGCDIYFPECHICSQTTQVFIILFLTIMLTSELPSTFLICMRFPDSQYLVLKLDWWCTQFNLFCMIISSLCNCTFTSKIWSPWTHCEAWWVCGSEALAPPELGFPSNLAHAYLDISQKILQEPSDEKKLSSRYFCWVPVFSMLMTLSLPEVRQTVFIIPALGTLSLPAVVVFSVSADVHHGVEGRGPTPDTAPWPVHHPVIHVGLR